MDTVIVIPKHSFNIRNQLDKGYKTTENLKSITRKVTSSDFNFRELFIVYKLVEYLQMSCAIYVGLRFFFYRFRF